jgi:hypothetical protein
LSQQYTLLKQSKYHIGCISQFKSTQRRGAVISTYFPFLTPSLPSSTLFHAAFFF